MRHTKYLPLDDRNKILTGQGGREGWWNAGWAGSGQQWAAHVTCPLVPMSGERDSAFQRPGQGGINPLVHDPQLLQTRDKHRHLVSTTSPLHLQGYQDVSHVWTLDKVNLAEHYFAISSLYPGWLIEEWYMYMYIKPTFLICLNDHFDENFR